MKLQQTLTIAEQIKQQLLPHCERIEIAGSIRRQKPEVKDIEIVCIPKPYEVGLFETGIATVINNWEKVKGELPCKYTQRILPDGIKVDIFFAEKDNWGYIFAIRTGSAQYSKCVLAANWVKQGFKGMNGFLYKNDTIISVPEEEDLFKLCHLKYVEPKQRDY